MPRSFKIQTKCASHTHTHTVAVAVVVVVAPRVQMKYLARLSDIVCKFLARHKLKLNELTSFSRAQHTRTKVQFQHLLTNHTHTDAR